MRKPPTRKRSPLISDAALARFRARPRVFSDPFRPAEPPPGVVPHGHGLAMDENISSFTGWAGSAISSIIAEGEIFLGFPYLAELSQRAEYRTISEVIATEMTRKWIKLRSKGDTDKADKIAQIEEAFERLHVRDVFKDVATQDGFFGRAHMYFDTGATDSEEELKTPIGNGWNDISRSKVKKGSLKALRTVEAVWCYPTGYNTNDPLKSDWYRPESWFVMGKQVHVSRMPVFIQRKVSDILKPAYSFGGLSMTQIAKPYVNNWLRARQDVSDLIHRFSVSGILTNLTESLNADGDQLFKRLAIFDRCRDNNGVMALDKDTEEFFNVAVPLGGLDALQAQAQEHMCSVTRIPVVKLLGIQPSGLNATSEGELTSFSDMISAAQEAYFRTPLNTVLGFVMLNEFGDVDEDITFEFQPLEEMNEKELAEIEKIEAETDTLLLDGGALSPIEVRQRIAAEVDSPYSNIDVEDVPEHPDMALAETSKTPNVFSKGIADSAFALDAPIEGRSRSFYLIRHGATKLNNEIDESVDRIRGWIDVPLSAKGRADADQLSVEMADKHLDRLYSSDLKRAADTAKKIAKGTPTPVTLSRGLRPWDLGKFAGETTKDVLPEIAEYVRNKPSEDVPGGECFNAFKARVFAALPAMLAGDGEVALVTHHRVERLLKAWISNGCQPDKSINLDVFLEKGEPPGKLEKLFVNMGTL